ncbi:NUDIX domain-containing protein [Rhizobium sp. WW_1]|uniref:NUDIX hydrolase n=1 Tax=Rhizobium sp. WW_1 TaxID=1907375 RepID=UPI00068E2F37|nr:NUDIX domain-containing protein [Rhizobium sp. WW_1]RKD70744.1 ADP-ribose pyrophosphatase YjhB (NUDIX family) [Rhizobium sp. WW_1]
MTTIVLAAFIKGGRVLMVRRAASKRHYPEHWDLVGGHAETDEPLDVTLVREAREEVGVTPVVFRYLGCFEDSQCETIYHLYEVTGWLEGEPRLIGDEHIDLAWVALDSANFPTPLAHPEVMKFLSVA